MVFSNTLKYTIKNKEEVFNRILLLCNYIGLSVAIIHNAPYAHKAVREYSAGMALICTIMGEYNCANGANWLADRSGANLQDELIGIKKIIDTVILDKKSR